MVVAGAIVCGFLHQLEALHHAEAVLFVDDDQPQSSELDLLLDQGVSADDQLRVALGDVAADFAFAIFFHRTGEQDDPVSGVFQNAAGGKIMLLGQDFGGRHQRDLVSIFHGDDGSLEGHDGLARSHIALQQTPHGGRLLHVGGNFLEHALLRRGGMEGQNLLDGFARPVVQLERDSGLRLLLAAFEFESQLQKEKFFKDQPDVRRGAGSLQVLKALAGIGPVDLAQGVPRRDQAQVLAHGGRYRIRELGREIFQNAVDDAPKPARGQAALAGRLVDGHDPADFERGCGFLLCAFGLVGGIAENFELRLDELQISAALLLHLAVKGYQLSGLEAVAQIGGVEPDALQAASALAGRHLKNGHAAGAEQARRCGLRQ